MTREQKICGVILITLFTVLSVALVISAPVLGIKRGDVALVPDRTWVEIMNPDGIQGRETFFNFGGTAEINYPGIVTVLGTHENKVLVRYKRSGKNYSIMCPNGGVFFLDKKDFVEWRTGKAAKVQKEKRSLKNLVRKLIQTG
jgi:hypothetical protein